MNSNVYIETYAIKRPYVGVGEFCLHLGRQLAQRSQALQERYGVKLYFIVPRGHEGAFGEEVGYVSFPFNLKYGSCLHTRRIDLLHFTHQYCKFTYFPHVGQRLLTIHDINFIYEKHGAKLQKYTRLFGAQLAKADYVNYISNFTCHDTASHFIVDKPSRVIYNGVAKLDGQSACLPSAFADHLPDNFLFHISSLLPKKNVRLLIDMMAYLPDEHLVIAGNWKSKHGHALQQHIAELGLTNIVCLHHVTEQEKAWLYENCKAFLFPSSCEGFGLPPIEAMHFGKPVFLSTLTSLPEVGGTLAFYWPTLEPEVMASELVQQLAHGPVDATAIMKHAARFSWEQCADAYISYYIDILQHQR